MQLASPITPCAASSFSIFRLSRFVMTISTPSLIRIDHSVPKVCADVASSPCTFLRRSISHYHLMLPGCMPDHIRSSQINYTCAAVSCKRSTAWKGSMLQACFFITDDVGCYPRMRTPHLKSSSTNRGAALNAAYVAARLSGASSAFDAAPVLAPPE